MDIHDSTQNILSKRFVITLIVAITLIALLSTTAQATAQDFTVVEILANTPGTFFNRFIDTGVDLSIGDFLFITATGSASSTGSDGPFGPDGRMALDPGGMPPLVLGIAVGALVGTVGDTLLDDGLDINGLGQPAPPRLPGIYGPGFVGSNFSITVTNAGRLYLGFNDGFDVDNTGSYQATIAVTPVPEPATVCLFGLGTVVLLRKRRF